VNATVEPLLRELAPRVLGALVRRYGRFDTCEDAVQEALLAAAMQWPTDGVPTNPMGWLVTVAARRLTDQWRGDQARRRREETAAALTPVDRFHAPPPDDPSHAPSEDDTLTLLLLCCHPELSPPSQLALTLRAVGGLTTAQIAKAFLVPEATMAQRISRAKQRIRTTGATFEPPPAEQREERLRVVLHVLYLIFNEGYTATSGPDLARADLTGEAIRLTRQVHRLLPDDGEVTGLLALMLLTDARRPARTRPDGSLVPLAEQDRTQWRSDAITEGVALITKALSTSPVGPYQVQAAIAAVHDEAATADDTDWPQILALYGVLDTISPGPMVTLNRAVALAMVDGPTAALALLEPLERDQRMTGHHRLDAVRAHLLEMAGDPDGAREHYRRAARRATSVPERRYLEARAAAVNAAGAAAPAAPPPSPDAPAAED
jgi:RNA polymerase sigma factor (sigma-70 family)